MAFSSLTGYQIVLIIILVFNFLFWFSIIVWRAMHMGGVVTASRRYMQGMRSLLRSGTPATRSPQQSHSSSCVNAAERGSHVNQPPPSYEEAIKYPSISSLLSNPHVLSAAPGHQNRGMGSESSSTENVLPGHVVAGASGGALKKQLTRSFSCGDLESITSPPADFSSPPQ